MEEEFKDLTAGFQEAIHDMMIDVKKRGDKDEIIAFYELLSSFSSYVYAKCLTSAYYLFQEKDDSIKFISHLQKEFCTHVIEHFAEQEEILQIAKVVHQLTGQDEENDSDSNSGFGD